MSQDLLPCPFCGGAAESDRQRGYRALADGRLGRQVAIYCTGCDADMAVCREDHPGHDPEDLLAELTERWNRRAVPVARDGWSPVPTWDPRKILEGDTYAPRDVRCAMCGTKFRQAPWPCQEAVCFRPRCSHCGSSFTYPILKV